MVGLILETCDRFSVMYDMISEFSESSLTESELASTLHLSPSLVDKMISLMLDGGFLKTGRSESDFRLTSLGFDFLHEFAGIRKFVG
jgi:predicted transcriptional regulator